MAEKMDIEKKKATTPKFRVSFPNVFKPRGFKPGDEPKYSIAMLFDKKTDLEKLKRAAFNAAVEKWGPKEKWPKGLDMPFRDGNEKSDLEGYKDTIVVNAKSKQRPGVIDKDKSPITEEDGTFYAGCYARAIVIAYAFDQGKNRGVAFSLQNVQKWADGKPFSGRKAAEDEFDEIEDNSDDPSSYGDDEEAEDDMGF